MIERIIAQLLTKKTSMPVHVIAICGARRAGKDTVADYLCERHGFVKASFAAPLKDMTRAAFGFSRLQVDGALKDTIDPLYGITPRQALQFMGTDVMQFEIHRLLPRFGPHDRTFWAERLVRDLDLGSKTHGQTVDNQVRRIVISDMRFPHEQATVADAVHREGGVYQTWRINRRSNGVSGGGVSGGVSGGVDAHASEQELRTMVVDEELFNDGDITSLHQYVEARVNKNKI
jgi:hypothetical protein